MKIPGLVRMADDDKDSVETLAWMRIPSLIVGLVLGFALSFATSRFEEVLARNVQAVFFIPFVVYMASAVGTQTQSIYIRDLVSGKAKFSTYLIKETLLGLMLGLGFGALAGLAVTLWLGSVALGMVVGMAMFLTIGTAPIVALLVVEALELERKDPAVGAGPIATVIQDTISILVYGLIASRLLL